MMFDDELADDEAVTQHLHDEIAAQPGAVLAELRLLRRRSVELRNARARLATLEAAQKANKRRIADLTRRLGSAHGSLKAYRAESKRLKSDLARLRRSRAMRVGRAITSPGRIVRSLLKRDRPAAVAEIGAPRIAAPTPPQPRPASSQTYEELVGELANRPGLRALGLAVNRAWYGLGSISDAAALLSAYDGLVNSAPEREAVLFDRIRGADRIQREGLPIPPRAKGAIYVAEPGRVMYCVHSTPAYNTNGYSTRTRGIASGLRQAGIDVVVAARVGYPWDSAADKKAPPAHRQVHRVDDVEYTHMPGPRLGATPTDQYILACADAFVREARLRRPALIHAASNHITGLAALIAARRVGVPFVYEVRGLWEITEASLKPGWEDTERYRFQADLETLVAREADAVLSITEETAAELVARGISPARIALAPNAVDPESFLPLPKDEDYARSLGLCANLPTVGFAGSMVDYEGLDALVDSVSALRSDGVLAQLVFAGSGPSEASLRKQVTDLGLDDQVHFIGRVPADDMPRVLSLFDIMPCPRRSLAVTEMVSPLKPLEALASAKAVILTDVSPHRVLAGEGQQRAVIVPPNDVPALTEALKLLIVDRDLRSDLGRRGRLWAIDERTWGRVATAITQSYSRARVFHDENLSDARSLTSLRVGIVADEFTTDTLAPSVDLIPLSRSEWRQQLSGLDLVLVESAWNGNQGEWFRGVGRYEDADWSDISTLITTARELGISTVFWNKEDPVHIERFIATASLCDHIFTTDANCLVRYAAAGVGTVRTVAALPFFAQPRIHNPLPSMRPSHPTVAYAGTYYGERYAKRSAELSRLLTTAQDFGLTIYDRQAAIPDSPYHFPAIFRRNVVGALPYDEVVDAYKSHTANLNVNSVADSPTMFSRRVVEIAACGGVVLSGPGRGITESLGPTIPATGSGEAWRAALSLWATRPDARLRESWRQMRTVLRGHTAGAAMTLVARTAGLAVTATPLPTYTAVVDGYRAEVFAGLARQSVLPRQVLVLGESDLADSWLSGSGTEVVEWDGTCLADRATGDFVIRLDQPPESRTALEDLLHAEAFGPWERISAVAGTSAAQGQPLAEPTIMPGDGPSLIARSALAKLDGDDPLRTATTDQRRGVSLQIPQPASAQAVSPVAEPQSGPLRVLIAGHDLKFATQLRTSLEAAGHSVEIDLWADHNAHDEERSAALLAEADVVWCEWGLGNAVWYSKHVVSGQRLIVRVHSQELRRPYLSQIKHQAVDSFIFVGELIREAAVVSHGVPRSKAKVVANYVDLEGLHLPKVAGAEKVIGFVGMVPQSKRLDRALDVLTGLLERGENYSLRIRGKTPADYPWLAQRPEESGYFDHQFARIDELNRLVPGSVILDPHGEDMAEWYRQIGVALSTSDFESFHLTIADGAASGAMPTLLAWPGADRVYPRSWICADVPSVIQRIQTEDRDPARYRADAVARYSGSLTVEPLIAEVEGRT